MGVKYDYLIVGAGLFGAVFGRQMADAGKRCLVIDKRGHIGGNLYTEEVEGIQVHRYGAHIFHTSDERIWEYVNRFARFNRYTNSPLARYREELYNLPFNMNTFHALWGVKTPAEAKAEIDRQTALARRELEKRPGRKGEVRPANVEEQALLLGGRDIYEKLVKGYTEKQWGKRAEELPAFILKRLPFRFTYDNNYFNDAFQGIPEGGYTRMVERMLEGIEVRLNCDYLTDRQAFAPLARRVVFTGMIDAYFDYVYGELEYRSLRFETQVLDTDNYQGNAVVNFTEYEVPYTRIIEHKHFEFGTQPKTVITREFPAAWEKGREPYYPVNDEKNEALYARYRELAEKEPDVIFGGRLGQYRYFDMHQVAAAALACAEKELGRGGKGSKS